MSTINTRFPLPSAKQAFFGLLLFVTAIVNFACSDGTLDNPPDGPIPENMVLFDAHYDHGVFTGNYHSALWDGNRIYATSTLRFYDIDNNFKLVHDSIPLYINTDTGVTVGIQMRCIRFNPSKSKIMGVRTMYPDISLGDLAEVDLSTMMVTQLLDSTYQISSAVYLSDDSIVYYSFGSYTKFNTSPTDAGYYLLIKSTGEKKFLLAHISSLGPGEVLNGFDVHPDHSRLLIPSTGYDRMPIVFEYDLRTKIQDTLANVFCSSLARWCLFLRYNRDGSKILFGSYPTKVLSAGSKVYDQSEIGIVDRASMTSKILETNPYINTESPLAICLFPCWSPNEQSIVYGSTPISGDGRVASYYQTTILKSVK